MDKKIIEELEIIITAKVEDARKDIKKIAQETSKMSGSIKKDIKNLSDNGDIKKFTSNVKKELSELQQNLNDFDALTIKDEIRTIGMQIGELASNIKKSFSDTSIGQSFSQSIEGWKMGLDLIKPKVEEIKNVLSNSTLGQAVSQSVEGWKMGFDIIKQKVDSLKLSFNDVANNVKAKVEPVTSIFKNIGQVAKNTFIEVSANIKESANTIGTPLNKLKNLINRLKEVKKESKKASAEGKSFGLNFGKHLNNGIKSIKRFALSLLSIRGAFSLVSKSAQAYLNFDTELQDSIRNSWNLLGSLLAPVLEYVASLFSKLVNIIAQLVQTMTGIDLVARANAKGLKKQEEQAKKTAKANRQLSSIDDIETLTSSNSNDGDEVHKIEVQPVNIKPIEQFIKKIKDMFATLFQPFVDAWNNVGAGVFDSLISMLEGIGELCSSVFSSFVEVWTNGTGTEIVQNVLLIWQQLFDIIGAVANAITDAWNKTGVGTAIIQSIANIFISIQKFALSIGDSIKKWVLSDSFREALSRVLDFIKDIFESIESVCNWLLGMYNKYLKPVIDDKLLPAINEIIIAISDIWKALKPVVDKSIKIIENNLEPVIKGLMDFIGGIIDVISGIAKFVSGVFTGDWKKAWDGIKNIFSGIWNSIASIFKTPVNLILSGIESMVNAIISAFNSLKKAINKISFDIPNWVPKIGGNKWGFNLKLSDEIKLPRLATGNVAYEPTTAIFGEYANARSNPEITSPVGLMADTFRNVLESFDFGGTRIDTLKIDVAGDNFYQGAVDYINNENSRNGVSIIKEV